MTTATPPAMSPMTPRWLRDLVAARTYYEETFGWPGVLDIEPHRVAIAVGDALDAIAMPAGLGDVVLTELRIEMLAGPVITDPDGDWWTFLTEPVTGARPDLPIELRGLGVHAIPPGDHVNLPLLGEAAGSPHWIRPPHNRHCLPPRVVVVATSRRVAARYSTDPAPFIRPANAISASAEQSVRKSEPTR